MHFFAEKYAALAARFGERFGLPLSLILLVAAGFLALGLRATRQRRLPAVGLLPGMLLGGAVVPLMNGASKLSPVTVIAGLVVAAIGWIVTAVLADGRAIEAKASRTTLAVIGGLVGWMWLARSRRRVALAGVLSSVMHLGVLVPLRLLSEPARRKGAALAPAIKWAVAHQHSIAMALAVFAVATMLPLALSLLPRSEKAERAFAAGSYAYFGGFFGALFTVAVRVANALPQTHGSKVIAEHEIVRASTLSFGVVFLLLVLGALLPMLLDAMEASGFARFVGARHIRATRSGFLSVISVLSICGVAVSSCALGSVISIMGGFGQDLKRKILANNAHVVVDSPAPSGFDNWEPVLERIRQTPGVVAATPVLNSEVMASVGSNTSGVLLRGVDVATVGDVLDLRKNIEPSLGSLDWLNEPERVAHLPWKERRGVEDDDDDGVFTGEFALDAPVDPAPTQPPPTAPPAGTASTIALSPTPSTSTSAWPTPSGAASADPFTPPPIRGDFDAEIERIARSPALDDRPIYPCIVVGRELAKQLHLRLGSELSLVSRFGELTPAGVIPRERKFRVAGIFFSGMYEYDATHAYVTIDAARDFLEQPENIGAIQVKVADAEKADLLRPAIERAVGREELRTRDWQNINKNLFGALKLERIATGIVLSLAIIVASFCILCTLLLMVTEKGKEIAILKSLGASDGSIVRVFMVEGMIIGGIGTIFGVATGYAVCFGLSWFGVRIPPDVYYIDRLPIAVNNGEFAGVALAALAICAISTVYPALAASSLRPVEGLRYE